jgi:HTH-type transcriptional regulator / antitoxin MqsA
MTYLAETFVEKLVTYSLELDGKFILIEHVPAKVSLETGEQLFSPQTVEKLQRMILEKQPPKRFIETPVYEFSA